MASPLNETTPDIALDTSRHASPPPLGLRQRPLGRAATTADPLMPLNRRRSSIFSDTLSDAKRSLKSSTDDLLLPRTSTSEPQEVDESSHWHSLPLGLALLPALGGLLFKNGSAVVTDITLLGLAAIFMNWSLRLPWDWYRGAQSLSIERPASPSAFSTIEEEDEDELNEQSPQPTNLGETTSPRTHRSSPAELELRIHEMLALASCFIAPLGAAWLLHAIRSQLSRPSEGLVSDYNLTIFLLVAELRPLSHTIKMIQRRTLFLQRKVSPDSLQSQPGMESLNSHDLVDRVEELEAHIAGRIEASETSPKDSSEALVAKASAQINSDVRRTVQPELDALGRAMRRYEKRTTISAVQFEARLQDLEASLKDVVVLAAAAQRTVEQQPKNYIRILFNWMCALVVVPLQAIHALLAFPSKLLAKLLTPIMKYSPLSKPRRGREAKSTRRTTKASIQERGKLPKP